MLSGYVKKLPGIRTENIYNLEKHFLAWINCVINVALKMFENENSDDFLAHFSVNAQKNIKKQILETFISKNDHLDQRFNRLFGQKSQINYDVSMEQLQESNIHHPLPMDLEENIVADAEARNQLQDQFHFGDNQVIFKRQK